jgi:hypothetical protein
MFNDLNLEDLSNNFLTAKPYPHLVIQDFFDEQLINNAVSEFPEHDQWNSSSWGKINQDLQHKYCYNKLDLLSKSPDSIQKILSTLISNEFVQFLEKVTGETNLYADSEFHGGGIHQIPTGGNWVCI